MPFPPRHAVRRLLVCVLVLTFSGAGISWGQSLGVSVEGEELRVRAPGLRFIDGPSLERLRDGASVSYFLRLTATNRRGAELAASELRFTVSYDLWEERFAVARPGSDSTAISHLTAREVEDWCLESLRLPAGRLPEDPFWIRLEHRFEQSDGDLDDEDDSLFTLGGLIDTLSRRSSREEPAGSIDDGPFLLSDLR